MWHCWPLKQKGSESHSTIWASHSGNVPLRPPCFWPAKSCLFIFFSNFRVWGVFFLSLQVNASWATLATTKQALFGVMHGWSDVSLMWEEGTTLGLKPGFCDLLPYILYLLVVTLSLRVTMQKSKKFETTKQCMHINDHPWHSNHQEWKLIELVISSQYWWSSCDMTHYNWILFKFFIIWPAVFNHYLLSLNYI